MTRTQTASERITAEVTSWRGVEGGPGSRGEFGFRVGTHEIGHLHGDRAAHFGFPRDVGAELREQGRVGPHPVNRHSTKMAARQIENEADVDDVIELMRLNYDRIVALKTPSFTARAKLPSGR
jgi:luciferase-like monooxygenase